MIAVIKGWKTAASSAQVPDDNMQREDTDPWYRQFWPWFIIALPASAVVAGFYTLWLAGQTTDSLVFKSDDGINVVTERITAAEQEAQRLGLVAIVDIDSKSGAVLVTLSAGLDRPPSLQLRLRHPTMASRDALVELQKAIPDAAGKPTWAGHFLSPPVGRYYLSLSAGDHWQLSGVWSGQATLTLDPANVDWPWQPLTPAFTVRCPIPGAANWQSKSKAISTTSVVRVAKPSRN